MRVQGSGLQVFRIRSLPIFLSVVIIHRRKIGFGPEAACEHLQRTTTHSAVLVLLRSTLVLRDMRRILLQTCINSHML